jgi:hypothetical protein
MYTVKFSYKWRARLKEASKQKLRDFILISREKNSVWRDKIIERKIYCFLLVFPTYFLLLQERLIVVISLYLESVIVILLR